MNGGRVINHAFYFLDTLMGVPFVLLEFLKLVGIKIRN